MAQKKIVLSEFDGGDSGRTRPKPNALNQYRGVNTWVYPNGAIGPRPPLQLFTYPTTGLPVGKSLRRFDATVGQAGLWYSFAFSDGTVYTTIPPGGAIALRGTLAADPRDSAASSDVVAYVSPLGDGGLVYSDGSFSNLTNMPTGYLVEWFGDRLVVLNNPALAAPVLQFSDPDVAGFNTWDPLDSQNVGPIGVGQALYVLRDALVIPKIDGTVWSFQGVIGFNETLRQIDKGRIHAIPAWAEGAVVSSSIVFYTTGTSMTVFTGAQALDMLRPDFVPVSGFKSGVNQNNQGWVTPLNKDQSFLVVGTLDGDPTATNKNIWMQSYSQETGWNRHLVPITTYSIPAGFLDSFTSTDNAKGVLVGSNIVEGFSFIVVPSAIGGNSTVRLYLFNSLQERPYLPPGESLVYTVASVTLKDGDTSLPVVASCSFAEWWAPDGSEVTVRSVQVDYTYDTDAAINTNLTPAVANRFDISIEATEPADGTTINESTAIAFVPTGGTAIDGSTLRRGRELFQFGEQGASGGFRIKLADWRGITIHRFTVTVDLAEART